LALSLADPFETPKGASQKKKLLKERVNSGRGKVGFAGSLMVREGTKLSRGELLKATGVQKKEGVSEKKNKN